MIKTKVLLLAIILMLGMFFNVCAYDLELDYGVDPINEISVSAGTVTLTISGAVAGSQPTPATDNTFTYEFTTNQHIKMITGQLDTNMPANTALKITLAVPPDQGWTSSGQKTLTADSPETLATGDVGGGEDLQISYEFSAYAVAGVISQTGRTVTITLADR
jgi:hypothetical protein